MSRVSDYIRSAANPRKATAKKRVTVRLTEEEYKSLCDLAEDCEQKPTGLAERIMSAAIKDAVDATSTFAWEDDPFELPEDEPQNDAEIDAVAEEALRLRNGSKPEEDWDDGGKEEMTDYNPDAAKAFKAKKGIANVAQETAAS